MFRRATFLREEEKDDGFIDNQQVPEAAAGASDSRLIEVRPACFAVSRNGRRGDACERIHPSANASVPFLRVLLAPAGSVLALLQLYAADESAQLLFPRAKLLLCRLDCGEECVFIESKQHSLSIQVEVHAMSQLLHAACWRRDRASAGGGQENTGSGRRAHLAWLGC